MSLERGLVESSGIVVLREPERRRRLLVDSRALSLPGSAFTAPIPLNPTSARDVTTTLVRIGGRC